MKRLICKCDFVFRSADHETVKKEIQNFETVHNMNVWGVEVSPFVRHTMKMWNTCVQYWIAICIYKRFPFKSLRTVATMALSALWHGYAAGYYFCICQVPLYLSIEDICTKFYNQCKENGIVSCLSFLNCVYTHDDTYKPHLHFVFYFFL